MSHLSHTNADLVARVRRIAGQVGAVERALQSDSSCAQVLHLVAAVRGAVNGLMDEIIAEHLEAHRRLQLAMFVRDYMRPVRFEGSEIDFGAARPLPQDFVRRVNAANPDGNAWAKFERAEARDHRRVEELACVRTRGHGTTARSSAPTSPRSNLS